MARRKNNHDWFNPLCEFFTSYSAWLCIPTAILAFNLINGFLNRAVGNAPALGSLNALTSVIGGSIAFVILAAGLKAGVEKLKRKKPFEKADNTESIRKLTQSEYPLLIAETYRRMGFEVVEFEDNENVGEIDLKLRDGSEITLVQCKFGKNLKIGVKPIRKLYAKQLTQRADRAIFVTSGIYTERARSYVIGKQIELIDGDRLCHWIEPTPAQMAQADSTRPLFPNAETPNCPSCKKSMLLQTVKRGPDHESQFWSCSEFPRCEGIREFSGPSV